MLIVKFDLAAWSIYNTIRYFIAFTIYDRTDTPRGQSLSFALGTCAGIALGLILCSKALFLVKHRLLHCAQSFRYLTRTCCILRYLSSLFILTPAIVNFVFLFVWRNSSNSHYNIHDRCHSVDIDIVWSASRGTCSGKSLPWGVWLTLSCIRLVLTLAVPVSFKAATLFDHSCQLLKLPLGCLPCRLLDTFGPPSTAATLSAALRVLSLYTHHATQWFILNCSNASRGFRPEPRSQCSASNLRYNIRRLVPPSK